VRTEVKLFSERNPIIVGAIFASGPPVSYQLGRIILAISPIAGIALSAPTAPEPELAEIQFAALCPTLLFVFVFGGLAVSARRRIDRELQMSFENHQEGGEPDRQRAIKT